MTRSTAIGGALLAGLVLVLGVCWWQRPKLARLGIGVTAGVGPVEGSADGQMSIGIVMPSAWGAARCLPDLTLPGRRHRDWPASLAASDDSFIGRWS